jgi:hypothetical protein
MPESVPQLLILHQQMASGKDPVETIGILPMESSSSSLILLLLLLLLFPVHSDLIFSTVVYAVELHDRHDARATLSNRSTRGIFRGRPYRLV